MAKTYVKEGLRVVGSESPYLSLLERRIPEGASQSFPAGSPLKIASGLAVVWVSVADAALAYWAIEAGHNNTGSEIAVIPALSWIEIEANFLGAAAADNVLAAADFGGTFDLVTDSNLLGTGLAGWYIQDAAAGPAVHISNFYNNQISPTSSDARAKTGDTNARVRALPHADVLLWNT